MKELGKAQHNISFLIHFSFLICDALRDLVPIVQF